MFLFYFYFLSESSTKRKIHFYKIFSKSFPANYLNKNIRTQSGGDTYFCIDALLRGKDRDFSILTPLGKLIFLIFIT